MHTETFYKVNCLDDALKAMIYVQERCILKLKDKYYLVTCKDNLIFSEFGTKTDSFCYVEDAVLCYIKDGDFVRREDKEKK